MGELDDMLSSTLEGILDQAPHLFPPYILKNTDVRERYHCYRRFCRTSDTRAIEMNVSDKDIGVVNRWSLVEKKNGTKDSQPMKVHYAQFELLLGPFLRYTKAMRFRTPSGLRLVICLMDPVTGSVWGGSVI